MFIGDKSVAGVMLGRSIVDSLLLEKYVSRFVLEVCQKLSVSETDQVC